MVKTYHVRAWTLQKRKYTQEMIKKEEYDRLKKRYDLLKRSLTG